MNLQAVCFDMDGVLLDSEPGSFAFLRDALRDAGVISLSEEQTARYIGISMSRIAADLSARYRLAQSPQQILEIVHARGSFYELSRELAPMPYLLPLLRYLKDADIRLAVVSSTSCRSVLAALNRFSLTRWFDVILGGDSVPCTKPAPDCYQKAASLLEAAPSACAAVEDSPIGIQAARDAGLYVIGFEGSVLRQDTSLAHCRCASFADCLNLFQSLISPRENA